MLPRACVVQMLLVDRVKSSTERGAGYSSNSSSTGSGGGSSGGSFFLARDTARARMRMSIAARPRVITNARLVTLGRIILGAPIRWRNLPACNLAHGKDGGSAPARHTAARCAAIVCPLNAGSAPWYASAAVRSDSARTSGGAFIGIVVAPAKLA